MSNTKDLNKFLTAKSDEELVSIVVEDYVDSGLSKEELEKADMDGIAKAHEKYDKKYDFSFNAYAVWWIRQRIIQAIHRKSS